MSLDVLQVIALCVHANRFFESDAERPSELRRFHPSFRVATEISFERRGTGALSRVYQETSNYLKAMKAEGVRELRPVLEATSPSSSKQHSDRGWGFLGDGDRGMEIWQPSWRAFMTHGQDQSPWHVTYLADRTNRFGSGERPDLKLCTPILNDGLEQSLEDFATLDHPIHGELYAIKAFWDSRARTFEGLGEFLPEDMPDESAAVVATAVLIIKTITTPQWKPEHVPCAKIDTVRNRLWKAACKACEIACLYATAESVAALSKSQPVPSQDLSA